MASTARYRKPGKIYRLEVPSNALNGSSDDADPLLSPERNAVSSARTAVVPTATILRLDCRARFNADAVSDEI